MKKLNLFLTAALLAFLLVACSDKSNDTPAITNTTELSTIDMVATHAIDLDISVAQLSFVPNSAAPWLGRIILLDDAEHLYSTDIEGRDPKPVGNSKYIDIFGLAREAAPGVFLAITEDNKIEAFIESDDEGNFKPMIYAGKSIDAKGFCYSHEPTDNTVFTKTSRNKISGITLTVQGNAIEQEIIKEGVVPTDCIIGNDQTNKTYLDLDQILGFEISNDHGTGLTILSLGDTTFEFGANIKNGLSVRGLDHIKYLASTKSNYGGGAYADGVLALVDKDENRIVFISKVYAKRQLLKAVNLAEDTPQ